MVHISKSKVVTENMLDTKQNFIRNLTIHEWYFRKQEKIPHVSSEISNQNLTSAAHS